MGLRTALAGIGVGVSTTLAAIAGGQKEQLLRSRGDLMRYAAMGGVIISTAAVAAVSAVLAVHMALRVPTWGAVVIGVCWGFVIFNLDRLLVLQMVRQDRNWVAFAMALPRLLLALILGFVISTPMVLQIFEPEITTELAVIHSEDIAAFKAESKARYNDIPVLETKIAAEQAVVDKGVQVDAFADPAVVAAQKVYDKAQDAFLAADKALGCETEGKCGTNRPGYGIAARQKQTVRDDAKATRDAAKTRLDQVTTAAQNNLNTSSKTAFTAATQLLAADKAELATQKAEKQAEEKVHNDASKEDNGLLARLEALDRLSSDRPTLFWAHWLLFALFLSIELLPVLLKLLQVLTPRTTYEALVAGADSSLLAARVREEKARVKESKREARHQARLRNSGRTLETDLDADRRQLALAEGLGTNRVVVSTQGEVLRSVLEAWRAFALGQSARDLERWERDIAGQTTPIVVPQPASPPPVQDETESDVPDVPDPDDPDGSDPGVPGDPDIDLRDRDHHEHSRLVPMTYGWSQPQSLSSSREESGEQNGRAPYDQENGAANGREPHREIDVRGMTPVDDTIDPDVDRRTVRPPGE